MRKNRPHNAHGPTSSFKAHGRTSLRPFLYVTVVLAIIAVYALISRSPEIIDSVSKVSGPGGERRIADNGIYSNQGMPKNTTGGSADQLQAPDEITLKSSDQPASGTAITQLPETETGTPPQSLPKPVPLGRETRDPQGAARIAAQQAADHERQLADSSVPRPGQVFQNARVSAVDIGVPFLPNSSQDVTRSSRTSEPGYGSTVSTELRSNTSLESALSYYRQQLREKLPEAKLEEVRPGPEFATLTASHPKSGTRVSVMLSASSSGALAVSLSRWEAGVSTSASPSSADDPAEK